MSTITTTTSSPTADQRQQAAARDQAAIARLHAAVVAMRTWRQLAPAPPHHKPVEHRQVQGQGQERCA